MSNVLNTYGSPIEEQMTLDTQMEALAVSERKRVLLVDNNDPYVLAFVRDLLELYIGCETTTVEDSSEALEVLKQEQELPDLIVNKKCLHSEDVSGYELLSFVKQNAPTSEIPFICLMCGRDENIIKVRNFGADAVITMPFEYEELLGQVKSLLKA